MDDAEFDRAAHGELHHLEDALSEIDPDDVEVSTSDGVLRLDLRDGTRIVINSHRAARQIWMAAVASAWHFDPVVGPAGPAGPAGPEGPAGVSGWRAARTGEELRATLARIVRERIGLTLAL